MERPYQTSANSLSQFISGETICVGEGPAWEDLLVEIHAGRREEKGILIPAVAEPQIVWTISGTLDCAEREIGGKWIPRRVKPGNIFITHSSVPYEFRWKVLGSEPLVTMQVFMGFPLLLRAAKELFGAQAEVPLLKEVSAEDDVTITGLLEQLRAELIDRTANRLFVQGIAQSLAVHLIRSYRAKEKTRQHAGGLPTFQFRKITNLMQESLENGIQVGKLAAAIEMSEAHFSRLFKSTTGYSPSQYFIRLRTAKAQKLLRETERSIIDIGMEVGYSSPSHFSQVFRKELGMTPHDYRRQNQG